MVVAGPGEIVPAEEFYTYDAKYTHAESLLYIPARIPEETAAEVREIAKKAYHVLGCRGMARVDFLIDGDTKKIYLNEPNTLPGFTDISMYPKLLVASGMKYSEIIDRLLELAWSRELQKRMTGTYFCRNGAGRGIMNSARDGSAMSLYEASDRAARPYRQGGRSLDYVI